MISAEKLRELRHEILSGCEEDYLALYEVVWTINPRYPQLAPEKRLQLAMDIVTYLSDKGLILLYRRRDVP